MTLRFHSFASPMQYKNGQMTKGIHVIEWVDRKDDVKKRNSGIQVQ